MSIIYINPYRFGRLWTPAAITTALWLDAADASTVTTVSGNVSQWNDKSGNGRNAAQGTAGSRPAYTSAGQNGLNTISFDGSSDRLSLASGLSLGTAHSIFVVAKNSATITAASSSQVILSGGSWVSPSTTTSELLLGAGNLTGNLANERIYSLVIAASESLSVANVYGYGKTNADVSGAFVLGSSFTTTGNAFTGRLNGSNDLATASVGGYFNTSTRYPTIVQHIGFRGVNDTVFWSGDINEIIITPTYLSSANTERIEGYLAHKWGLAANLPNDHPFKSAAPTL
ncbi:MAG: Synechococcus phage [Cyanobacteriota bacterium]|jgi:hypothetical protein